MIEFFSRMIQVVATPETFFVHIRNENRWGMPVLHLLFLAFFLSLGSVIAWRFAIPGDTPINSSLGSQMDVYPYWRDTLLPAYGNWSYPLALVFIMLEMIIITAIWTPVVFVVFRYLGGAKEPGGLLRAFQGFVYGLTPCLFGGFLPYLALATGVYATLLQFYRGPAIILKNRTVVPFLFVTLFLALAIARYWAGGLL
jgi:hypothetical protein